MYMFLAIEKLNIETFKYMKSYNYNIEYNSIKNKVFSMKKNFYQMKFLLETIIKVILLMRKI